jgi:hypothetical protein
VEEFGVRAGPYSAIHAIEVVKENQEVSLGIDEAQENPIAFEEVRVSRRVNFRSDRPSQLLTGLRTLRLSLTGHENIEKVARSGQE